MAGKTKTNLKEIRTYVNEIIEGNNKNLGKLKKLITEFFKGKTQQELEKIGKKELGMLSQVYDLILKNNEYSELDKAYLDYIFNKPMKKYVAKSSYKKVSKSKFISLAKKIYAYEYKFPKEEIDNFLRFFGWMLLTDSWDDTKLITQDKELEINISISYYNKMSVSIFAIGSKKYEDEINSIISSLK